MRATASPRADPRLPRRPWLPGSRAWATSLRRHGVRTLGVLLGSFDPPHLGHEWMARRLLERCDAVLLLVPTRHLDKRVLPPHNAGLAQRLEMLALLSARLPGLAVAGLTREVLFVRLQRRLERLLPGTTVVFGMGADTFLKVVDSARLAPRLGATWEAADEAALPALLAGTVVFARRPGAVPGALEPPGEVRELSSTAVRALVAALRPTRPDATAWQRELRHCLAPEVIEYLAATGLYP